MPEPPPPAVQPRSAGRRSTVLAAVALTAATVAAYHNSFSGALVFDDLSAIRDNPTLRSLWPISSVLAPPENSGVGGRPLANLSYALNYAVGGTSVRGYHVVNLLLHVGSSLCLFGIVRRTRWNLPHAPGRAPSVGDATAVAFVAAVLWSVHPLTTASVTWISQRTELLMAFCYLATLYAFIRGIDAPGSRWLVWSMVACAAGMMSKEVMVTAPVLVLLYDRAFVAGTFREALRRRTLYYAGLAATWLVLAWLLTTGLAQRSVGFGQGVSTIEYALTEARALGLYLKLAFWPSPLVFDYGPIFAGSVVGAIAVLGAIGLVVAALRRRSAAGFLGGCFFLLLAPTSSFVPVVEQPIAENRMYLPLAAVVVLVVAGLYRLRGRRGLAVLLPVALALGATTVQRNRDYRSELALWRDTVEKRSANPRANYNYGVVLLDAGRADEAARYLERATRLKPGHAEAHNSLGNAWLELGRFAEAEARYAEAVRLRPDFARAWFNYGLARFRQGDAAGAIERFERALQLQPDFADVHNSLGNVFFQRDDPARAIPHYRQALRLDPTLADAHYNCGSACFELGRIDEAVGHFTEAARLKPDDFEVRNNLGAALLRGGRRSEAIAQFEHALRLKPDYADARSNLELARSQR
jgi:protein O-mannosyl-transferase